LQIQNCVLFLDCKNTPVPKEAKAKLVWRVLSSVLANGKKLASEFAHHAD
jgi:hypothetical protein